MSDVLVAAMSGARVLSFLVRRFAILAALLLIVSFLVFTLQYISPGSVIDVLLGPLPRTPETIRALRAQYHLDQPFFVQYWLWLKGAVQLHFGTSVQASLPVSDELRARVPVTLFLGLYASALAAMVGVGLGVVSAFRRGSFVDRAINATTIVGLSTPGYVGGVLLLYLFAVVLRWFPTFGKGGGFFDELWHLTLPASALAISVTAYLVKHTRAAVLNVLDQDYVVFARARGLRRRRVLFAYVFRNALIPIVTVGGILVAFMLAGTVFVEQVFNVPGVGSLLVEAATNKDMPPLQGVALLIAFVIMTANLLVDIAYAAIDPRIRMRWHSR